MSISKQQAIDIIERDPVGGAHYYNHNTGLFYNEFNGVMLFFAGVWVKSVSFACGEIEKSELTPMHELLAIAEGEG